MAKKSPPDNEQNRLAQVEQSDLGESQLNEEFIDWLKKWGNQILLAVLVVALLGVGWQWLERTRSEARDTAWANLDSAQLPASLEEIAEGARGVDAVTPLALMRAADQYLGSVQTGARFDREASAEDYELDDDTRTLFLQRADALYAEAIVAVGDYETVFARKLLVVSALFGQAAVAESRGDTEQTRSILERIKTVAAPQYPELVRQAEQRMDTIITTKVSFPLAQDLPQPEPAADLPDPSVLLGTSEAGAEPPAAGGAGEGDASARDATNLILQGGEGSTEAPGDGSD